MRESLKNMLLVMNTTSLFDADQPLTVITKDRIHSFLPGLWDDVFKVSTPPASPSAIALPPTNSTEEKPAPTEASITIEPTIPMNVGEVSGRERKRERVREIESSGALHFCDVRHPRLPLAPNPKLFSRDQVNDVSVAPASCSSSFDNSSAFLHP